MIETAPQPIAELGGDGRRIGMTSWSPNSESFVFTSVENDGTKLYVVETSGRIE